MLASSAAVNEDYKYFLSDLILWWLLCRGVKVPASMKKKDLIARFVFVLHVVYSLYLLLGLAGHDFFNIWQSFLYSSEQSEGGGNPNSRCRWLVPVQKVHGTY